MVSCPTDKDSLDAKPPHNALHIVPTLAVCGKYAIGAVSIVRLIEANLRRRRGIWQVVNVFRPRSMPGKVNHRLIPIVLQICRAIAVAELAVRIGRLHVIPQHQFLGVGMQIHLLVSPRCARDRHPGGHRVAVQGHALRARLGRSRCHLWWAGFCSYSMTTFSC